MIWNRPAPPLPHLYLSEENVKEAATFIGNHINVLLHVSEDIALGRDSRMFIKLALCLLLISVIESVTDFLTLIYTGKFHFLVIPTYDYEGVPFWSASPNSRFLILLISVIGRPCYCSFSSSTLWKIRRPYW